MSVITFFASRLPQCPASTGSVAGIDALRFRFVFRTSRRRFASRNDEAGMKWSDQVESSAVFSSIALIPDN